MARQKRQRKEKQVTPEVQIELTVNGEKKVFRELAPNGVPPELVPHLADFWKRGFTAHVERRRDSPVSDGAESVDLSGFAAPLSGRPVNPEVHGRGRKATELHAKGLTYGQIALKLCSERTDRSHTCGKKCADRIRQEANDYLNRKAVADLQKTD